MSRPVFYPNLDWEHDGQGGPKVISCLAKTIHVHGENFDVLPSSSKADRVGEGYKMSADEAYLINF